MNREYYTPPTLTGADLAQESTQLQSPFGGFGESVVQGALDSFGLGTAIRDLSIPAGVQQPGDVMLQSSLRAVPFAAGYFALKDLINGLRPPSPPMTQQQYQNSQWFRPAIPYDPRMTEDRAAALATFYDAAQVRQQRLAQTPGWVPKLLGGIVGQALDPINYIPFLGEAAKAAAVEKLGVIGGHMLTASADAALNTAAGALATAPARQQFGDDTSLQSTLWDVASAAVIGAAFGGIGGALAGRRLTRERAALRNVTETHAALNDAVGSILNDGEVRLRPETVEGIAKIAAQDGAPVAAGSAPEVAAGSAPLSEITSPARGGPLADVQYLPPGTWDPYPGTQVRTAAPEEFQRLVAQNQDRLETLQNVLADGRRHGEPDNYFRERAYSTLSKIPLREGETWQGRVERNVANLQSWLADSRAKIAAQGSVPPGSKQTVSTAGAQIASTSEPVAATPKLDQTAPPPEAAPQGLARAAQTAAKPQALKDVAEDFRLDPETGDFPELADYQSLEARGALTEAEKADFDATTEILQRSKTYADALQQAAICGMN